MVSQEVPEAAARVPFGRRIVSGVSGACFGAGIASSSLAGILAVKAGLPFWTTNGLVTALGLLVGALVGVWMSVLDPGSKLPALRGWVASKEQRWRVLLSGPALLLIWALLGHLSLRVLSAYPARPRLGGVLTAASALLGLLGFAAGVDRLASVLARKLTAPSSAVALGIAFGSPALFIPLLVFSGTTSGTGSVFALFGTLRRPELDLSPVWQLGLLLGGAGLGAQLARRLPVAQNTALLALALLVGLLGLRSASVMSYRAVVEHERTPGLGALSLRLGRSLTDRDGDGFSSRFGGGDCDDRAPGVNPRALDIAENGIDDDCRGGDRKKPTEKKSEVAVEVSAGKVPEKANVLLLTIDTMRWDLGFSGAKSREGLSPELDALAKRSTVFERAYSLASYTSKSLGPMLIGKYPSETKRTFEHFDRFSADELFLQERLQRAGISTSSVQGYWYFFFKGYGFERGWDSLDSSAAPKSVAIEGDRTSNGDEVAERTIEKLGELATSGRQFFFWSHWVDPHSEYVPHEQFDFGADARARYDGEIAFVDQQVGKVIKALSEKGLDDRTVVIITSDHGEAFGEHGMIRHGFEVWEELVRVPLLIHVPGASPKRVAVRRSSIDLVPTVLEALALPQPEGESLPGTSLLRDVFAPDAAPLEDRPVLVDMPEGPHNRERRAYYDGAFKLTTSAGQVLGLYDLSKDPGETQDLSGDPAELEPIRQKMDAFLDRLQQKPATR